MASKWKPLKHKIDSWKPEVSFQAVVDEEKRLYGNLAPAELARQMKKISDRKDTLESDIKHYNVTLEALSQLIVAAFENSNLESIEFDSGMKCALDEGVYIGKLDTPEAIDAYRKWENRLDIRKMKTLNAKTRDSLVRDQVMKAMVDGKPVPKQFAPWVKLTFYTKAKLYGKKNEPTQAQNGGSENE